MRRKDRQITDTAAISHVIDSCDVCRIAISDGEIPYIVPMNFGYTFEEGVLTLYLHGASEGRKIDLIRAAGGWAAFEMDTDHDLVSGEVACDYSFRYHSVIGGGVITFAATSEEKEAGLRQILRHYGGSDDLPMQKAFLAQTCVMKMTVTEYSCKGH